MRRLALLAVLALAAWPQAAGATTYCAYDPACEAAGGTHANNVQHALNLAQSHVGPDRVEIGPDPCPSCKFSGGSYASSDPLEVVGAGQASTTLSISSPVLSLGNNSSVSVSDLIIDVPAGSSSKKGLSLTGARAERVDVVGTAGATNAQAVLMTGGAFQDGVVSLEGEGGLGFKVLEGSASISDVLVGAEAGIFSEGTTTTVQRVHIAARRGVTTSLGTTNVDNALIDLGTFPGATGLFVGNANSQMRAFSLNARHVTIVGSNGADQYGASVNANTQNQNAVLDLRSSVVSAVDHPLRRTASHGTAHLSTSHSHHRPPLPADDSGTGAITETSPLGGDPRFVDEASGDFRLSPGSPLLDGGEPTGLTGVESPQDLAGNPRLLNGDADCQPRRDVGAYEFVASSVFVSAVASPPATFTGQSVTFDGTVSCDPNPAASLDHRWSFDDGAAAAGPTARRTFATPGQRKGTLTVTSSTGRSGSAIATTSVSVPPIQTAGTPPPPRRRARKRSWPLALIMTRAVRLTDAGVAPIPLHCTGRLRCTGVLELSTPRPGSAARRRLTKLGARRFSIRAGRTTRVKVRLRTAAVARVAKRKRLTVMATLRDRDAAGRARTVTRRIILKAARR